MAASGHCAYTTRKYTSIDDVDYDVSYDETGTWALKTTDVHRSGAVAVLQISIMISSVRVASTAERAAATGQVLWWSVVLHPSNWLGDAVVGRLRDGRRRRDQRYFVASRHNSEQICCILHTHVDTTCVLRSSSVNFFSFAWFNFLCIMLSSPPDSSFVYFIPSTVTDTSSRSFLSLSLLWSVILLGLLLLLDMLILWT